MIDRYIIFTGLFKDKMKFSYSLIDLLSIANEFNIKKIFFITWPSEIAKMKDDRLLQLKRHKLIRFITIKRLRNNGFGNFLAQMAHYNKALEEVKSIMNHDNDNYILKSRTDVSIQINFLKQIFLYDYKLEPNKFLSHKIWIPWAHKTKPFYFEDATFYSHFDSMEKLYSIKNFNIKQIGQGITHIRRFINPFLGNNKYSEFCNIIRTNKNNINIQSVSGNYDKLISSPIGEVLLKNYYDILNKYFYVYTETPESINFRIWNKQQCLGMNLHIMYNNEIK